MNLGNESEHVMCGRGSSELNDNYQAVPSPMATPTNIDNALIHLVVLSISPRCWPSDNSATRDPTKMTRKNLGV